MRYTGHAPRDHEILKHFRQIRQRTIDLLERIPEEMLTRQADGETLLLGRLFKHIAYVVDAWMDDFLQDGKVLPRHADDGQRMGQEHPTMLDDGVIPLSRSDGYPWERGTPPSLKAVPSASPCDPPLEPCPWRLRTRRSAAARTPDLACAARPSPRDSRRG